MSLVISSDILAGVLNAAPAAASRRASERLERLAGVDANQELRSAANQQRMWGTFIDPVDARDRLGFDVTPRPMESTEPVPMSAKPEFHAGAQKLACDAYRGFESMMLRNMFEELLPAADGGSYGSGLSGRMWRSMVADNFASLYATAGGIGISEMLAANGSSAKAPESDASDRQWPYFRGTTIAPFDVHS